MAVSVAAVGSWLEFTTDATYTLPSSADGDRLVMYVTYKDRNTTSALSGWTEHETHTDGAVASGNGVGSMRSKFFYIDRVSGAPSNPLIDVNATVIGAAVCYVLRKGASETWDAPLADTPATAIDLNLSWNTSETITSGGGAAPPVALTEDVKDGSVVICGIGIRDDSATLTRSTAGIDDAGGLITWNGNYVEDPATHFSTTTGNDMAADIGYRLITTGTTSAVTLRTRGTLGATETGSGIFFVQGVTAAGNVTAVPTTLAMTWTGATPTITQPVVTQPTVMALTWTGSTPAVKVSVISLPTTLAMTWTGATPTVATTANVTAAPTVLELTWTGATPTVATPVLTQPTSLAMTWTGATPAIVAPVVTAPTVLAMTWTGATPSVTTPVATAPDALELALSFAVPAVVAPRTVLPLALALAWTGATPFVEVGAAGVSQPTPFALALAFGTPTVSVRSARVRPRTRAIGAFVPEIIPRDVVVRPRPMRLHLTLFSPEIVLDDRIPREEEALLMLGVV